MKKQIFFIVLMLMPLIACADPVQIDGIYYNLIPKVKQAEVTNGLTKYLGNVVIPENVEYEGNSYSVTSIGDSAFHYCTRLTSVTIPNSVTTIGNSAFAYCSGLTSITIGNSVTSIGGAAFRNCSGLTSVTIGNSVTSIEGSAFRNCSGLTSVTIGNSVTSIGSYAFYGCSDLTSVTIPNSVTSIGSYAFHGCSGLISVTIPNSVTSIGNYAFRNCSSLTSVTIPTSVTSIGINAFSGCSSLLVLNNCRYADTYLVEVVDKTIATCTIKEGTRFIGDKAFYNCANLTSLTIGNDVTSIGNNAFQGCSVLSSVSIGKEIKSVGAKAFANCPEIKEVYCYAKEIPAISNDTFENSYYIKWATLYVPESSVDLYKASAWSQFGNIVGITGGNEGERCEKPVITLLANGKIKVESATEGATCVTNITASNAEPLADGEISLNTPLTVYTVTSYATKEGYNDSEVATATFRYEKSEGDMNGDGILNITDVIHLVNMILGQ